MNLGIIESKLRLGKPVPYGNNSFIYQPTVDSIDELTEEVFNQYILPFAVNLNVMDIEEEHKNQIKIFDLFFIPNVLNIDGIDMIMYLYNALKFFFKTENIIIDDKSNIIIDNRTIINRDNFEELQEIILKICCSKKLEKPKEKVFKNETQKKIYDRIQKQREEYRKRHGKNNENENILPKAIDEVVHDEDNSYTYLNIGQLTYWQLIDLLSVERIKDEFKTNIQLISCMTDGSKLNLDHWKERIVNEIKY